MNSTSSKTPARALVLAGAGAAGNAWQIGLVAGLAEAGVDLTRAELVIGTSAGSTAAAMITSGTRPAELYAATQAETAPRRPQPGPQPGPQPAAGPGRAPMSAAEYLRWSDEIIAASADAADWRRRMSAAILELDASDEASSRRWHDTVAARLPSQEWPQQRVLITAVDARTAQPVVFDRGSGIQLTDAVAASTSNGTAGAYQLGEHRYINGAYRRGSNADLATGYDRVLVLDPFSGRSRTPLDWGMDLAIQVDELRAAGSSVETVFPDAGAGEVFNATAADPSTRPQAARGGYQQGRALAGSLAGFWG
ncbi:patatin-like phospholipase family protein [Lysinimonas soli]|uniref:Patatin-like phospholipase family protein n=1 Tax=Lysinimonas soli TaxID=1074233 RepID=A0ABW0NQW0_9MICO